MKAAQIFVLKRKQIGHLRDRFLADLEDPVHEIQATEFGKKKKLYHVISLLSNPLLPTAASAL